MDTLIGLIIGLFVGCNFGFVVAGLFGGIQDEDVPD